MASIRFSIEVPDTYFDQVLVLLSVPLQAQPPQQVLLPSLDQLVENVEVPLPVVLVDHAGLLQQVIDDVASHRGTLPTGQRPEREGGGRERGEGGGEGKAGELRCDAGVCVTCRYFLSPEHISCTPTKWGHRREEWCDQYHTDKTRCLTVKAHFSC